MILQKSLDPPYSPRQISECYKEAGLTVGMKDTQNAALYGRVKKARLFPLLTSDVIVLKFWLNSTGMGEKYGFEPTTCSLRLAHNDTICLAERRICGDLLTLAA